MGLWDTLKSIFGGGGSSGDGDRGGFYFFIRCDRCRDVVRVRVNLANELQQEFSESEGVAGYSLRKGVVDAKCFRPMEATLKFDGRRREVSREVEGGQFVSREEYEAARSARDQQGGGSVTS